MILAAVVAAATLSQQLTTAAEELLSVEKKIAASTEGSSALLFGDVLALLDEALDQDSTNVHAHALTGEVLLLQSENEDGTYDVCSLLEARKNAEYVLKHSPGEPDAQLARQVMKAIKAIPPEAVPDDPDSCKGEDERHGSKTRSS